MKNVFLLALGLLAFLAGPLRAQVPNLVNYQGRISVGSANFTGTGQFRFALVSGDGTTAYWSNDGSLNAAPGTLTTSVQPGHAVALTVTNGLYSVLLGDTTVSSFMTTIPTSVWTNNDVRLRVWFDNGTMNGIQRLTPDQRLAPTGYLASGLTLAGTPNFTGDLNLPATTSASTGVLDLGGSPFLHAYGANGLSSGNTFAGSTAGNFTLSGTLNTGDGYQTLAADTSGTANTASGATALKLNTTGNGNTAAGFQALLGNTAGSNNSAVGNAAMYGNTTAGENVAFGTGALQLQSFANGGTTWNSLNVAVGYQALYFNQPTATTNGINNVAVGGNALFGNTTGANNIAVGNNAGMSLTTGSNNIDIGSPGVAAETGIIRLGDGSTQTATYLTGVIYNSGVSSAPAIFGTNSVDSSLGLRLMNTATTGSTSAPNVTGIAFGQNSARQAIVGETFGNDGLDFYVSGNMTTPKVRIDANGRVGIGNFAPLYTLDVTGIAHVTSAINTDGTLSVTGNSTLKGNVTVNGVISGNGSGLTGITASGLAANSVTSADIVSGAVGSTQLASGLTLGGTTTISGDLNLPVTTSASVGVLNLGGSPFLHAYGQNGLSSDNTFVGGGAGDFTLTGIGNTGVGFGALASDTTGFYNVACGASALGANTTGARNTAGGFAALYLNTMGSQNTAYGYGALLQNSNGSNNIALGFDAGSNLTTGSNNIDIGSQGVAGETGIIRIGDGSTQTITYLTGNVGVGGATPTHGTLEIGSANGSATFPNNTAEGFNSTDTSLHGLSGTQATAIYANGAIVSTNYFVAISDARVKLVLGRSDAARDLDTLGRIEITDYRYKDVMTHGDAVFKKVIAQQVEQVFPPAVTRGLGEIPDIYQRARFADGWIELATDLKPGERVKLIAGQEQGVYEVLAVEANRFRTAFKPAGEVVFVYGREVQDFRAVDYDAIAMLNVSATQELARKLTRAEDENTALKQRVAALEAKDKERDTKLAAIEELLRANPAPVVRPVSFH